DYYCLSSDSSRSAWVF
nr:immunoglobulin light chain junction region [Macaca mulatta]MOV95868.1 immunoglobulin light chain junction region [Macaca mulatta]MOV97501.1 immunoglobulin light chain junction region [Macaca mulatta]